jgi:hypothetical protein
MYTYHADIAASVGHTPPPHGPTTAVTVMSIGSSAFYMLDSETRQFASLTAVLFAQAQHPLCTAFLGKTIASTGVWHRERGCCEFRSSGPVNCKIVNCAWWGGGPPPPPPPISIVGANQM